MITLILYNLWGYKPFKKEAKEPAQLIGTISLWLQPAGQQGTDPGNKCCRVWSLYILQETEDFGSKTA